MEKEEQVFEAEISSAKEQRQRHDHLRHQQHDHHIRSHWNWVLSHGPGIVCAVNHSIPLETLFLLGFWNCSLLLFLPLWQFLHRLLVYFLHLKIRHASRFRPWQQVSAHKC